MACEKLMIIVVLRNKFMPGYNLLSHSHKPTDRAVLFIKSYRFIFIKLFNKVANWQNDLPVFWCVAVFRRLQM